MTKPAQFFIGALLALLAACEKSDEGEIIAESTSAVAVAEPAPDEAPVPEPAESRAERIAREFPLEARIKQFQIPIKARPDRDSENIGFVRRGVTLRAKEPVRGPGCTKGWLEVHPRGYLCAGTHTLEEGEELPRQHRDIVPPARAAALPFDYYFVTLHDTPVFKRRLASGERERVLTWLSRLKHFKRNEEKKLDRFLAGELKGEPEKPSVIDRLLARGYYISSPKDDESGRLKRNVQGEYFFADTLQKVEESSFEGVWLKDGLTLPLGFTTRPARPQHIVERDGAVQYLFVEGEETIPRYTLLQGAKPASRRGDFLAHEIGEGRVLKDWFVGVAEAVTPPFSVEPNETWIHIDIGEQTLVLYRGETPVFFTLVSTGVDGFDTPEGVFRIQNKFVGRTMADVSPDTAAGDRYRIEDVPFTQFYQGSFALHGAFWHNGFGIRRSHGCINLSPRDARTLFESTEPKLPEDWFAIYADVKKNEGTRLYVTP